jgi:hypothetical protein
MIFDLGSKNTLTSVNYTGGDTGGGNATVSYSFRNFNNFFINASGSYRSGIAFADNGGAVSAQSIDLVNTEDSAPVSYLDYNSGDNNNV